MQTAIFSLRRCSSRGKSRSWVPCSGLRSVQDAVHADPRLLLGALLCAVPAMPGSEVFKEVVAFWGPRNMGTPWSAPLLKVTSRPCQ